MNIAGNGVKGDVVEPPNCFMCQEGRRAVSGASRGGEAARRREGASSHQL